MKLKMPNFKKIKINDLFHKIVVLTFVIGFVSCLVSMYFIIYDYSRYINSEAGTAIVTNVSYGDSYYDLLIEYKVNGKDYKQNIKIKLKDVTVNEKIDIRYMKNNPYDLVTEYHILYIVLGIVIGTIVFSISFYFKVKKEEVILKIRRIKKVGIKIIANVDEIYTQTINKKVYYILRVKYINPTDDKIFYYERHNIKEDIKSILEEKNVSQIPVFINPKNPQEYYVDLEYVLPEEL